MEPRIMADALEALEKRRMTLEADRAAYSLSTGYAYGGNC
jgi:hypothetical protein